MYVYHSSGWMDGWMDGWIMFCWSTLLTHTYYQSIPKLLSNSSL